MLQLTYPETAADTDIGKDEKRLKEILQQVDLEYLLERPNALTQPMAWGEHGRLHTNSQVGEVFTPTAAALQGIFFRWARSSACRSQG